MEGREGKTRWQWGQDPAVSPSHPRVPNLWGWLHRGRKGLGTTQSFLEMTLNFFFFFAPLCASSVWKQPIFSLRRSRMELADVAFWFFAISNVFTGCVTYISHILISTFMCPFRIWSTGNCLQQLRMEVHCKVCLQKGERKRRMHLEMLWKETI